jgi:transglutaminase-like putative cysteine protease
MSVFKIHHITRYQYERAVAESVNEIRIVPYQCPEQEVLQHDLIISHHPTLQIFSDYWGNRTGLFSIPEPHRELTIESKLIVRTLAPQVEAALHPTDFNDLKKETENQLQLIELMKPDHIQQQGKIDHICTEMLQTENRIAAIVEKSSAYIFKAFKYTKGITTIETTVDEILLHHGGVCQDFAHVLLQMLRTMQIPCRYVSGYICPNKNGMRGEGATHAWVEAWIPGLGWKGIDPTNNVWVKDTHVKLAVGRNFSDCTPVKGTFKGPSRQDLYVFVSVGYEDGHVFEETTLVQMEKQKKTEKQEVDIIQLTSFAGQQQQ